MRRADLLCHPCEHEGVSKIILEAMMLGLPVLASDVPPLPDYVIEGETGYRVANTPEAWAAKLVEIAAAKDRLAADRGAGARLRRGDLRHRGERRAATRRRSPRWSPPGPRRRGPRAGEGDWRASRSIVAVVLAAVAALVEHHAEHLGLLGELLLALVDLVEPAALGGGDEQHAVEVRQEGHHVVALQHRRQVVEDHVGLEGRLDARRPPGRWRALSRISEAARRPVVLVPIASVSP